MIRCLAPLLLALAASFSALTSATERLMLTGSNTVAPLAGVPASVATVREGRYTAVIVTHNLAQVRRVANYAAFFWMAASITERWNGHRTRRICRRPKSKSPFIVRKIRMTATNP